MKEKNLEFPIHLLMTLCGGFFGAYAIFNRFGIFANAQTANLIELVGDLIGRDFSEVLLRLGAFFIFVLAIILSVPLERHFHRKLKYLTIAAEMATVIIVGFFPEEMNPFFALYPLFFIAALQWCTFTGAKGFTVANIFSTNNVKQTFLSLTEYFLDRKKNPEQASEKARKAQVFGGTLLAFYSGAAFGYGGSIFLGLKCIWICLLPLFLVLLLLLTEEKKSAV